MLYRGRGWQALLYGLRPTKPPNASIIWWSCQFAVCILSALLGIPPPPEPKPTLVQHLWGGSEVWRGGETPWVGRHGYCLGFLPPLANDHKNNVIAGFVLHQDLHNIVSESETVKVQTQKILHSNMMYTNGPLYWAPVQLLIKANF